MKKLLYCGTCTREHRVGKVRCSFCGDPLSEEVFIEREETAEEEVVRLRSALKMIAGYPSHSMHDAFDNSNRMVRIAIDALSATDSPKSHMGGPEGWVLVPRTPTDAMMQAGLYQSSHDAQWSDVYSSWVDMVDAAQNDLPKDLCRDCDESTSEAQMQGVKPLSWESSNGVGMEWSDTIVGQYRVHCGFEMGGKTIGPAYRLPSAEGWVSCNSLQDAKAAAQGHFEELICSAFSTPPAQMRGIPDWENPEDPVVKLFVGFDVEEYVDGYEWRGDEGDYSPNEQERALLTDAIYGVVSEIHEALRKLLPSAKEASDVQ